MPANVPEGAVGLDGGAEADDKSDPISLEELYATRWMVTVPPSNERLLLPISLILAFDVTLTPE